MTKILTSAVLSFGLVSLVGCGGDNLEVDSTTSPALCYPNWQLISNNNPICHVDKDHHLLWYTLQIHTNDSYQDLYGCYSGPHYIKRKVDEIDCSYTLSTSTCLGSYGPYPIDRDNCTGPWVNEEPVCYTDSDCEDGLFCTGEEYCDQGACRHRNRPCLGSELACDESRNRCIVTCGGPGEPICR